MSCKLSNTKVHLLTPPLRFQEFREHPGWKIKPLGSEGEFLSSLSGKSAGHFGTGNGKFVTYMNVFSNTFTDMSSLGTVDVGENESQNRIVDGDVLFTVSSETPHDAGMSSVVQEDADDCYLNSFCTIFRFFPGARPVDRFTGYAMRQPLVRKYLKERAQGATRFNLSRAAFRNIPFAIPGRPEQQKIADCLTSLDELIAAQGRKVEALKAHKKGLMQQLFPREGEAVPRLRFPRFRAFGEWLEKPAGTLFRNRVESGSGGLPIYSVTMNDGLVNRSSLDRKIDDIANAEGNKKVHKYDIAYNMMRMWQGASGVAPEDCMVSPAYVVLAPGSEVHAPFFGYLFKLPQYLKLLTAHSQGLTKDRLRLYYKDFVGIPLPRPDLSEQKEIASALQSIDELILVASRKLNGLKTHKKGLMQQLFPSPEAMEA